MKGKGQDGLRGVVPDVAEDGGEDVIICRCEEVSRAEIRQMLKEGLRDADEIRKFSRVGLGLCQGRTCRRLLWQVLEEELGTDFVIRLPKERPPVGATKLSELVPCQQSE